MVGSGAGDVAGNPDFPPTAAEVEVNDALRRRLADALAELRAVLEHDLPALDRAVAERAVPVVGR
jgi:hypothetical protein